MTVEYLKKASKTAATGEDDTRRIVSEMLADIEAGGEDRVRHYASSLDGWTGDIVVSRDEIAAAASLIMGEADEGLPAILLRGLAWSGEPCSAASLLRSRDEDLFR